MNTPSPTPRIAFRDLLPSDAPDLARVLMDRYAMRFYDKIYGMEDVHAWIARQEKRYKEDGFGLWAMIRNEDGAFLGNCGITLQMIDGVSLPEVGFQVIAEYCRKGYATEGAMASLRYAFSFLGFDKIYSYCTKLNEPSQGVMKNCGLRFEKSYVDSIGRDVVVYSIGKDDFLSSAK